MSQPNKEDYEFYSENQLYILLIVTRAISAIGIIPFLIIGIVYYKRRTSITITMIINIQLCFSQFIGNAGNFYPLINTKELEQSALCTIQGIQFYFASYSRDILIFIIILFSYLNFTYPDKLVKHSKKFLIIVTIVCWSISTIIALCYLIVEFASSPTCLCRAKNFTPRIIKYAFFGFFAFVSNIFIIMLLYEMKKQTINNEDKIYWKK